jgi:hypothetical protein
MSEQRATQSVRKIAPNANGANGHLLQRKCVCGNHASGGECNQCGKKRGSLQRSAAGSQRANEVPPIVHEVLRSPGQPLDRATREFFEPRFRHDFSQVRVHPEPKLRESVSVPHQGGGAVGGSKKNRSGLQTKLKVNEPGDIYEQEADRIGDQVMATSAHSVVSSAPPRIQRFAGQPTGQMDAVPASVDQALASLGRPLEPTLRQDMEQRFGYDLSRVRVHSGAAAEQSAREVNAHAYAAGHHIVFDRGQFAPGTSAGRRLIAHELVHTIQQESVPGLPNMLLQRVPKEQCGTHFHFEFDAVINDKPLVRGVPRVYYSQYPTKTDPTGQRVEPIISQTKLPAGQRSSDGFWRAVCHQPKGAPPQILWVLNDYVSREERQKEERKREEERKPEAVPKGKNVLEDCSPDQTTAIQKAVSRALADLDGAITALSARPLSEHAHNALFLAFRAGDIASADNVLSKLRAIRDGLPTVGIQCEQGKDPVFCTEGTGAYTNPISGVIHLCMNNWDESDAVKKHPRVLIHEGAHAFVGAPGANDPYFDQTCNETSETSAYSTQYRLGKADPLACVVYHLRHRTAESAKFQKELYSGEALKRIVQSMPTGPISLSAPPRKPSFLLHRAPIAGGFTYRWRLYDDADRHYLLRGEESGELLDWLAFTDQGEAIIGSKTRGLLAKRNMRKGRIDCTIRLPDGTEKTLSLDLEFTP